MISAEQLIAENQLVIMREQSFNAKTPFMRDLFRTRVLATEAWLALTKRDAAVRRADAARTRKFITGNGKPKR